MTYTEIVSTGIPIDNTSMSCLMVQSALEWIKENTTLPLDISNIESIKALPFGAKLFILKYVEIMSVGAGVTSESISGLSQSFDSISKGESIRQYARELLGKALKSEFSVVSAMNRWG